jgi:hypothetical protein
MIQLECLNSFEGAAVKARNSLTFLMFNSRSNL